MEEKELQSKPIVFIKYPIDFDENKRRIIYQLVGKITNNIYDVFLSENIVSEYEVKILNIEINPEIENHKNIILSNLKNIV